MKITIFAVLATGVLILTNTAFALEQKIIQPDSGQARSPLFSEFKRIEADSHKERIRILQEADACIRGAADRNQYQVCEQREQDAREKSKATSRSRREALREKKQMIRQVMNDR